MQVNNLPRDSDHQRIRFPPLKPSAASQVLLFQGNDAHPAEGYCLNLKSQSSLNPIAGDTKPAALIMGHDSRQTHAETGAGLKVTHEYIRHSPREGVRQAH